MQLPSKNILLANLFFISPILYNFESVQHLLYTKAFRVLWTVYILLPHPHHAIVARLMYTPLNSPRTVWSQRLHFFRKEISKFSKNRCRGYWCLPWLKFKVLPLICVFFPHVTANFHNFSMDKVNKTECSPVAITISLVRDLVIL